MSQVDKASEESFIICLGDFNIDLEKWEDCKYYQKNIAKDYQLMIGNCGLEIYNFGFTWRRKKKNIYVQSAIDHAFTNKPLNAHSCSKTEIDYSDHDLIYVKINWKVPKLPNIVTKSRDFRKLKSNPDYFLNALTKIDWSSLVDMHDLDNMERF